MALRLILGLVKGALLGALVGWGLLAAGLSFGWLAYVGAALVGMLVALVAGKPIWATDARIEVGMKAAAGAVLGPGLMWLARSFLTAELPFDPSLLPAVGTLDAASLTLGGFFVTSLALVGAVLAGFYDADNEPAKKGAEGASEATAPGRTRIATGSAEAPQAAAESEPASAEARRRRGRS